MLPPINLIKKIKTEMECFNILLHYKGQCASLIESDTLKKTKQNSE